MPGPLEGLRVVELAGLGPTPFCAMLFADMGAEVIRIDRRPAEEAAARADARFDVVGRGRRSLALDLKKPEAADTLLHLVSRADALIEGFRPGVMERLGLGPDVCLDRNPRLVYGRMTGWGQTGPLSMAAGHDINYIALTGALHAMGQGDTPPPPPLNLVGDYGGGGMLLAFGVLCALLKAREGGKGQVVDAAMTDGASLLTAVFHGLKASGRWSNRRGENLLDGGAHFYGTYVCADGKFISVGAIEPQFYKLLMKLSGVVDPAFDGQLEAQNWPELKRRLAEVFKMKDRAEWCKLMEGTDACFAPVLDWDEAAQHPHNLARKTFLRVDGIAQPAPAPRFSLTPPCAPTGPAAPGEHNVAILEDWGFEAAAIERLKASQAI